MESVENTFLSASSSFTFLQAPLVEECRFNAASAGITVTFDQPTDQAGARSVQVECSVVIQAIDSNLLCLQIACRFALIQDFIHFRAIY